MLIWTRDSGTTPVNESLQVAANVKISGMVYSQAYHRDIFDVNDAVVQRIVFVSNGLTNSNSDDQVGHQCSNSYANSP